MKRKQRYLPFEEVIKSLTERGLLDADRNVTAAGEDYTRELLARYRAHNNEDSYLKG